MLESKTFSNIDEAKKQEKQKDLTPKFSAEISTFPNELQKVPEFPLPKIPSKLELIKQKIGKPMKLLIEKKDHNYSFQYSLESIESIITQNAFAAKQEEKEEIGAVIIIKNLNLKGCHALIKRIIDRRTNKEQACKYIRSNDPEIALMAENEQKILKTLDHPSIIQAYDLFIEPEGIQLIMEYVPWKSIDAFLKENNKTNEISVSKIISKILLALAHVHEKQICHRDISAKNVLISPDASDIKIIDFGIAKQINTTLKENYEESKRSLSHDKILNWCTTPIGNLRQMAPEMREFGAQNERVDIWAVGILTLEMLINKRKLDTKSIEFQTLSVSAKEFILKCLQKNPEKRISAIVALQQNWFNLNSELNQSTPKNIEKINSNSYLTPQQRKARRFFYTEIVSKSQSKKVQIEDFSQHLSAIPMTKTVSMHK